jgi:hypothetical protein
MDKSEHNKLKDVILFVRAKGCVCFKPGCWDEPLEDATGNKKE